MSSVGRPTTDLNPLKLTRRRTRPRHATGANATAPRIREALLDPGQPRITYPNALNVRSALLGTRNPELLSAGSDSFTISFSSGPNVVRSTWFAACYPTKSTFVADDKCDQIYVYGEAAAFSSGTLPFSGTVSTTLSLSTTPNTYLDCFVGLLDAHGAIFKCSFVDTVRTAVAVPPPVTVASVMGGEGLIVSSVAPDNGDAVPIAYKVQCLDATLTIPTACDESGTWVDATNLATGQEVGSLTPNTDYVCFVAATYDDNGTTQYACSAPSALTATAVAAPTASTAPGPDAASQILVSGTSTNGDAVPITYKVQCLDASGSTPPTACDTTGAWVDVATSLPLGQVVGSLTPNTIYVCFAAATYEDNGTTQYACSAPSALTSTVFYF